MLATNIPKFLKKNLICSFIVTMNPPPPPAVFCTTPLWMTEEHFIRCRRAIVSRVILNIQGVCWKFAISFGHVIYYSVSYSKARVLRRGGKCEPKIPMFINVLRLTTIIHLFYNTYVFPNFLHLIVVSTNKINTIETLLENGR